MTLIKLSDLVSSLLFESSSEIYITGGAYLMFACVPILFEYDVLVPFLTIHKQAT